MPESINKPNQSNKQQRHVEVSGRTRTDPLVECLGVFPATLFYIVTIRDKEENVFCSSKEEETKFVHLLDRREEW